MGHRGYHLLLILCWVPAQVQLSGGLLAERSTKPPPTLTSRIVSEANPGGAVVLFGTTAARKSLGLFLSAHHAGRAKMMAPQCSLDLGAGWPRMPLLPLRPLATGDGRCTNALDSTARAPTTSTVVSKGRRDTSLVQ